MILKFHYHQQEKVLMDYYIAVKLWIPNSHGQKFSIPQKSYDPPTRVGPKHADDADNAGDAEDADT